MRNLINKLEVIYRSLGTQPYGMITRAMKIYTPIVAIAIATSCALWPSHSSAQTAWQLIDDGDPSYANQVIAYDSARDVTVLTSGAYHDGAPITWELEGDNWVRKWVTSPTSWYGFWSRAVYDSNRGVVVLYGPLSSLESSDTWEWDGSSWTIRTTNNIPPPRVRPGLAYDSSRNIVVMFGGLDPVTLLPFNDTWEYDGTDWIQITPTTSPGARDAMGMCFDSSRNVVVMFGGQFGVGFNDTWEYDGSTWVRKFPSTTPPGRFAPAMACDPVRNVAVMFGGGPFDYDDTWEWDGTNWQLVATPTTPAGRMHGSATYDSHRAAIVMYGGSPDNSALNDTWQYDGSDWTQIAIPTVPKPRMQHGFAFDSNNNRAVVYGGIFNNLNPRLWDTWHFKDGQWTEQMSAGVPSASRTPLAFDSSLNRVVGFSGSGSGLDPEPDIHEYSGTPLLWNSTPTATSSDPRVRDNHGWVASSNGMIMFGGYDSNEMDDTWRLNGNQWTEIISTNKPSSRSHVAMAFDKLRNRIVLHGGSENNSYAGRQEDLWILENDEWSLLSSSTAPGARFYHHLTYDVSRDRFVLYGDGPALEGVTWEFDGTSWASIPTPVQPDSHRCGQGQAYDEKNEIVLLFGGRSCVGDTYYSDTWAYGSDPDEDGIVGGLDNCRSVANGDQANADGDAAGDVCDCASSDPGVFAAPVEVDGLVLDGDVINWNEQASTAGDDTVYDLVSGDLFDLRANGDFSMATCLAGDLEVSTYTDTRVPVPGDGFYHLARAKNVCGVGTFGRMALDAASPCP